MAAKFNVSSNDDTVELAEIEDFVKIERIDDHDRSEIVLPSMNRVTCCAILRSPVPNRISVGDDGRSGDLRASIFHAQREKAKQRQTLITDAQDVCRYSAYLFEHAYHMIMN